MSTKVTGGSTAGLSALLGALPCPFCGCKPLDIEAELSLAATEIESLRAALKQANSNAEWFEREWYLRGDALDAVIAEDRLFCRTKGSGNHRVWQDGRCAAIARAALQPNAKAHPTHCREENSDE